MTYVIWVYAALTAAGGLMGATVGKSAVSGFMGVLAGVLLAICGVALNRGDRNGFYGAVAVTTALLILFAFRYLYEGRKFMPAGMSVGLAIVVLAVLSAMAMSRR